LPTAALRPLPVPTLGVLAPTLGPTACCPAPSPPLQWRVEVWVKQAVNPLKPTIKLVLDKDFAMRILDDCEECEIWGTSLFKYKRADDDQGSGFLQVWAKHVIFR
jgi:hypothetical protein